MRAPLCIVAVATIGLSGCGSDGDEQAATTSAKAKPRAPSYAGKFNQKRVKADFKAMEVADTAASAVYDCMQRTDNLKRCDGPVINGSVFKIGKRVGRVEIKKPIDTDFAVSSRSSTGSVFTAVGSVQGIVLDHTCRAHRRDGGCRDGAWFRPTLKLARGDHRGQDDQMHRFMGSLTFRLGLCASDERSYSRCKDPKKLASYADTTVVQPPLPLGSGRGQVELRKLRRESFEVIGHSDSGNDFVLAGRVGRSWVHRCRAVVADGRCRGGRW